METLGTPEPLGPAHDRAGFACGLPALDDWLRRAAPAAPMPATFVLHETSRVRGFYTLAAGTVRDPQMPPGRALPILKLGRLAVDGPEQGRGLGTRLVLDAFARTYAISRHAPVAALMADPPADAAGWLAGLGFQRAAGDASAMFVALGTIEALVEA